MTCKGILGSSLTEKGLGGPVSKLNTSQQCTAAAMKASWILGWLCRGITGTDGNVIILFYSVLVRLHTECCTLF